jgi:RHH-type transcriptional regulator, rel operon repressor / antitoxin RelB
MLAVRLDKELEERLTIMAKRSGRSKSDFVRRAIEDRIEEMECIALLEAAMRDPEAGQTRSLDEVVKELGLDA